VAKIVDRDDDVVFSSIDVDIETWERVWKSENAVCRSLLKNTTAPTTVSPVLLMISVCSVKWINSKTVLGSLISNFVERQARPEFLMKLNRET